MITSSFFSFTFHYSCFPPEFKSPLIFLNPSFRTPSVFYFEVDGIRLCHLGDLGHQLSDKQIAELGKVDILLIPVGGFYTIDAKAASQVCNRLTARVIIPMHYKTDKCGLPIAGVDEFVRGKEGVKRLDASQVEFKQGELPATTQIEVLKSAL